jgi:L-fucose isomerase-like protein
MRFRRDVTFGLTVSSRAFFEEPEISNLGVIGTVVGPDDRQGTIKTYVGEGDFTNDPLPMDGGIAVTAVPRLRELLTFIVRNGFEHHAAMVRGYYAKVVGEAVSRYLGWQNSHHEAVPRFAPPYPFLR